MTTTEVTPDLSLPVLSWAGPKGWRKQIACGSIPTFKFFKPKHFPEVRKSCNVCSVNRTCLEFAVRNGVTDGLYGGMTPSERKNLTPDDFQ